MDRRQALAALVAKTGVRIDDDDPAFLLVELNALLLDARTDEAAQRLAGHTAKLGETMTQGVDDFVAVANEALSKFMQRTNEIKTLLDSVKAAPASQKPAEVQKAEPPAYLWWLIPGALCVGMCIGIVVGFVIAKL